MIVAVDVTPLRPPVSGVGQSVRGLLAGLAASQPGVEVRPWELTRSAAPLPPRVLLRLWSRLDRPRAGRWVPDADVVHGTNFVVPPGRRPATVTVHDCWSLRHPDRCSRNVVAAGATVRRAVRRGVWLHVPSRFVAGEVRELLGAGERVRVVPWGVPELPDVHDDRVPRPAGAPPVDGPYVLALGAAGHRKGIDTLVRAARAAGVPLVITGDDPTEDLGVVPGSSVVRLGAVDDACRSSLLRDARVLAYPSRYEGFGLPVLEAMSVGVPVVASALPAVKEVAGDAALLVPPDDVDALAGALRRSWDDDRLRADLVARGRAKAATFTWEATAAGMVELWRAAIEDGSP